MKKVLAGLQKVENAIMISTFIVMVCSEFAQVLNRNIFKIGIGWFEELAVFSMIWMTLLGAEMGLRDGTQVSIVAVVEKIEKLSPKAGDIVKIIAKAIVIIFTALMFDASRNMVMTQVKTGQVSAGLAWPMWIPYSALMVGFGIMTVVQIATLVAMVIAMVKGEGKEAAES